MGIPTGLVRRFQNIIGAPQTGKRVGRFVESFLDSIMGASFSIGAEDTNAIVVSIQLKNEHGDDLSSVQGVWVGIFADANGTAFNANDYTIAAGTDGALVEVVADKLLFCTCEADGDLDISLTIAGAKTCYLGVILPSGKIVMSSVVTHAA